MTNDANFALLYIMILIDSSTFDLNKLSTSLSNFYVLVH